METENETWQWLKKKKLTSSPVIDDCAIGPAPGSSPCQNNGTCRDEVGGYACQCTANYTGENCTVPSEKWESLFRDSVFYTVFRIKHAYLFTRGPFTIRRLCFKICTCIYACTHVHTHTHTHIHTHTHTHTRAPLFPQPFSQNHPLSLPPHKTFSLISLSR